MPVPAIRVADEEFHQLMGMNMHAFSARLRAETMAYDLKSRISSVASDLRHWIAAGEVTDPRGAAQIANAFDHLANQVETKVCDNAAARSFGGDNVEDLGICRVSNINEYDMEAWHAPADDFPGKGNEGH